MNTMRAVEAVAAEVAVVAVVAVVAMLAMEVVVDICKINTKETSNSSCLQQETFLTSQVNVSKYINLLLSS